METQERYEVAGPEPTRPGGLIGAMTPAEAIAWCEEHDAWLFHQRGRWTVQVCWGAVVVHETGPSLVDVVRRLKDSPYARFCHVAKDTPKE